MFVPAEIFQSGKRAFIRFVFGFHAAFERIEFVGADSVDERELIAFFQQVKMFALPVYIHQNRGDLFEHARGNGIAVDFDIPSAVRKKTPVDDEYVFRFDPDLLRDFLGCRMIGNVKRRAYAAIRTFKGDHRFIRLCAEHEIERVDHDGFSRTRFAGKHVQPCGKFDFRIGNQRYVFDF